MDKYPAGSPVCRRRREVTAEAAAAAAVCALNCRSSKKHHYTLACKHTLELNCASAGAQTSKLSIGRRAMPLRRIRIK